MKKSIASGLVLSSIVALTGCGGGSSDVAQTAVGTGYYVDSAVEGVSFLCGDESGITDAEGKFTFTVGQDCTFRLANVLLRTVPAEKLVDKAKVVEDNVAVAAFLQTADIDGDASNGIQISEAVVASIETVRKNDTTVPQGNTELSEIFNNLKTDVDTYKGQVVSETEAQTHLQTTQANVVRELLAGQTFYMLHTSNNAVEKIVFNQDLTEITWTGLVNSTGSGTDTIVLEGNKLTFPADSEGSYTLVSGTELNYILFSDYNGDGSANGSTYAFATEGAVTEFLNSKLASSTTTNDSSTTTTTTTSTSTIGSPIVPYTQTKTVSQNGQSITQSLGADGQLEAVSVLGYPNLALVSGVNNINVTQMIVETSFSGSYAVEGVATGTSTRDFAQGTDHIVATSATYGSADCINTYPSPLPINISILNAASQIIDRIGDDFESSTRISTTCPDWINADSNVDTLPTYVTGVTNRTITSDTGVISHTSEFIEIK